MSPGDANQNFDKVCGSGFIFGTIASKFWPSFRKTMDGSTVMRQKVSFLATLGHFGAFLAIKEPLGRNENYFRKIENVTFPPCNSMQNFRNTMDSHWEFLERTHARMDGRTRVNYKVPIRLKSGDQQWKCNQHQIKMNFGAKNFLTKFFLKNSKSNIPPPPWFNP